LVEYRDLYRWFRTTGANVVAVSVDAPEKSESLRRELQIPFPILSDRQRRLVREWDVFNPREKGGIAKPAVFILAPDRTVRFVSVDEVASRVPAAEISQRLSQQDSGVGARRRTLFPGITTFLRAIRNAMRTAAQKEQ
jgi:peroxiredoxin